MLSKQYPPLPEFRSDSYTEKLISWSKEEQRSDTIGRQVMQRVRNNGVHCPAPAGHGRLHDALTSISTAAVLPAPEVSNALLTVDETYN